MRRVNGPVFVQRLSTDKAYFIAKELLMTERTYHKDLSIVVDYFREFMSSDSAADVTLSRLYECLQPVYDNHCELLDQLEARMSQLDARISDNQSPQVADLLTQHFDKLEVSEDNSHTAYDRAMC